MPNISELRCYFYIGTSVDGREESGNKDFSFITIPMTHKKDI